MSTHSAPTHQTQEVRHLFPLLLSNGYVPIPNRDKVCMLPKWSTVDVDEAQCRKWARQLRWPAIGLRVEPPLLVLDYDIPDPAIMKAIEDITPSKVFDGLERIGSPPKTAFFLRMFEQDELFREAHTRRYHFEGQIKPAFAVQSFAGGGGGAQFGAFGPHSHDEDGNVIKTYSWVGGRSPANVPLSELPVLTRAEVMALLDAADALLKAWPGMVVDELSHRGEAYQQQMYDLDDTKLFVDSEGFEFGLDELIEEAKARHQLKQANIRLTGSFTGDNSSGGSARCKVWWSEKNGLSIVDYKTGKTHHPIEGADDLEVTALFNEIFKKRGEK